MAKRAKRKADRKRSGQPARSETVRSMTNLKESAPLRARTPENREAEMRLRVLVQKIALLAEQYIEE